jgi:hypothetical protein
MYVFVMKYTNEYNIEYIHNENLVYGGLDLTDSSTLTTNPACGIPSAPEKMNTNPIPTVKEGAW